MEQWDGLGRAALNVQSVIDSVELALRDMVLDQKIAPDEPVKETKVAQAFGVSRPTAKAAIERLVAQGLLRRDVHRSARVPVIELEGVEDLYRTRSMFEEALVRALAERGEAVTEAEQVLARWSDLGRNSLPAAYVDLDIAFHAGLSAALASHRTSALHHTLLQEMRLCMAQVQVHSLLDPAAINQEHRRIATAIRKGDAANAVEEMRTHLILARDALAAHLRARSD